LRNTTCPAASAPCAWKTRFAMSSPIVLHRLSGGLAALPDARASFRRVGSAVAAGAFRHGVLEGGADHVGGLFGGPTRARVAGVCARLAEPGETRGAVPNRRVHGLPLAAGVAGGSATRGQAARRRPGTAAGCGGAGRASGDRGRGQRPELGRVCGQARGAHRCDGERSDHLPRAAKARAAA
jgi:hypothetical protein